MNTKKEFDSFGYDVLDVSACFFKLAENGDNCDITHLKLQKLVYYAQGISLGRYKKKLFDDSLEAWRYGPVCKKIYKTYRHMSCRTIGEKDVEGSSEIVLKDELAKKVLADVWEAFGRLSGNELEELSHQEIPWQVARRSGNNAILSDESMSSYFGER